ncbi:hypothetical protein [Nocardioides sp. CER19]|uniref:hypothetical protein n=1 Tax=Nocardioides sp. CER19 TaxID=3038538 RepID=UPI0024485935|nr:hypothetical protein [Nocardioides sp. CER19]MDH2413880.1 hypothetical protein [Nocardioides sp. CER19]
MPDETEAAGSGVRYVLPNGLTSLMPSGVWPGDLTAHAHSGRRKQGTDPWARSTTLFSLIRESALEPDDYLDRFFDTGGEREQASG